MKIRTVLFLLASLCFISVKAQDSLTLQKAISEQYRQYYPDHLFGFSWIPTTSNYSYLEKYRTLVIKDTKGEELERLNIETINEKLETSFFYFSNLVWKNKNVIIIRSKNKVIQYNLSTEEGKKIELPTEAENYTYGPQLEKIAYTIKNNLYFSSLDKFNQQTITSNEDENIVSGQSIARNEFGISGGIFWSPSGDKIAFYVKDESKVYDFPLLDINQYPGELISIKYPMAGQPSEEPSVGIFNIKTKKSNYLKPKHGADNYLTNLSWTPDGKHIILAEVARNQNHIWVQKYADDATFEQLLFEEKNDSWVEPERPAYFPSKESNDFVWVSEKDGFDNLYYYNEEGTLIRQLTSNKFPLMNIVTANNEEIYFTATGENPLNTMLYRVDIKGKQKLLTNEDGTHNCKVNSENGYVFDQYSSLKIPSRAVIRSPKGKIIQEVLRAENPLEEFNLPSPIIQTLTNKEGVKLYTRMIKPTDFDSTKKYPVLIYVYGGPHVQLIKNKWLGGASLWMYWLANQGYVVYTLDNRGSANRGASFEHVIHRELGKAAFEDQMEGVKYLKSLPYVDENRIAVHGWSFGGFMTMTLLLDAPQTFQVGVAGGPVTDWKFYEVMYGERYMDSPKENPDGYASTSLLNKASNLTADLLICQGSIDPVVLPQHALSLVKKFVDLGIQMDYFPYPMHEHNVRGKDRVHLMTKVLNYIMEHNK